MAPVSAARRWVSGRPSERGFSYALLVLLGFALATASFVAASLYADRRLQQITRTFHDVSDNALPSVVELAAVRRELVYLDHLYDELAEGDQDVREIPPHWDTFEHAQSAYERVPQFPGEAELWQRTRTSIEDLRGVMRSIAAQAAAGRLAAAENLVKRNLIPAARSADDNIAQLISFNREFGRRAAADTDSAWSRARRLTFLLDAICVTLTAALALAAYVALRRNAVATRQRAEELEAFASRVAHDIRSPLQPSVLALQSFARQGEERQRKTAERGLRGLHRVEGLVDDLLAYARSGAGPDRGASASLREVVAGVVQDVERAAAEARIDVEVGELPPCETACAPGVLDEHRPEPREQRHQALSPRQGTPQGRRGGDDAGQPHSRRGGRRRRRD